MKQLRITIFAIIIIMCSVYSQNKSRPALSDQKSFEQKALERQLSYAVNAERAGNYPASYNSYFQLIKKYETDVRIITGFIDLSIKVNRIKECEIYIKDIIKKYPVASKYIDPDNEKEAFSLIIRSYLADFFLRTGRAEQAYQIFAEIDKANSSKKFISEIRAMAFFRSGSFYNAEKIFISLRKDLKDDRAYSNEMYQIYLSTNRVEKFTKELLVLTAEFQKKKIKGNEIYNFNPQAELYRLFETEEYKDSILLVVERSAKTESQNSLLSELYFNDGQYDKSYQILKNSNTQRNTDLMAADFAVRLYSEKKYKEAASFFGLSYESKITVNDDDFINLYITCLELSDQFEKAEEIIKSSSLKNKYLLLARLYHNDLNKLDEADKIYSEYLTKNISYSEFWKDYIKLKITKKDFNNARALIDTVFEDNIIDIFTLEPFYEFKFIETIIALCEQDIGSFYQKADKMIKDDFISDYDNDLLKIVSDVELIQDDKKVLDAYIEVITYKIDPKSKIGNFSLNYTQESNYDKQAVIIETEFYCFMSKNDKNKIVELIEDVVSNELLNNNLAKLFVDFCREEKKDEKINNVLLKFLKSSINDEIKTEVREIIREKQLS